MIKRDNYINIAFFIIIIYTIFILYNEYKYNEEIKNGMILTLDDFNNKYKNYDSELYNKFKELSDSDKEFINDYVNHIRINHRKTKPSFDKKINNFKSQVIYSSIMATLFNFSFQSLVRKLKQNTIQHVITSLI